MEIACAVLRLKLALITDKQQDAESALDYLTFSKALNGHMALDILQMILIKNIPHVALSFL